MKLGLVHFLEFFASELTYLSYLLNLELCDPHSMPDFITHFANFS